MKVTVEVDADSARSDVARDSELGVNISFEHEGIFYPDQSWNDFGVRLIGFWLKQLLDVSSALKPRLEFVFLDGDFSLQGTVDQDFSVKLAPLPADEYFEWRVPYDELKQAIMEAGISLTSQLTALEISPRGLSGLEAGLRELEKANRLVC